MSTSSQGAGLQQKIYALEEMPLGGAERKRFIDREIAPLLDWIVRGAAATGAKRRPGVNWGRDGDDITQDALIASLKLLDEIHPGVTLAPKFNAIEATIYSYVRGKVRDASFSSIGTGLSGASGAKRRAAALHHRADTMTRDTWAAPDKDAVVAAENERLDRSLGGKRIHSARATDADFSPPVTVPINDFDDVVFEKRETDVVALRNVGYDELATTLSRVLDAARRSDPELAAVAELWFPSLVAGEPLSAAKIATQLGCKDDAVRARITRLRQQVAECWLEMCTSPADVVAAAIKAAQRKSDLCARVAEFMYADWPKPPPTEEEISAELDLTLTSVRKAMATVYAAIGQSIVVDADSW
ncbi:MAG: hypothetical protein ACYCR4_05800 [Acidimicrobiales bacterium]